MTDENKETSENEVTEITDDQILDAIEDGVAEVSPHLEDDNEENDESGTDDDAGTDEGEPVGESETNQDAADDGDAEDEDADASGSDTDTNEEDGDSGEAGEDSDGDGGDEDPSDESNTGEPDHINDPIPESTNEKTAERIKGLIDIAKEQTHRADQGQQIIDAITNVGADAEQFNNTLTFLDLYNSKDPKQRAQALAVAKNVVHELSVQLGEGTVDLLDKHDDLKAEVEEGKLTQTRAVEIATQRERDALNTARQDADRVSEDEQKAMQKLVEKGREQLNAFQASVQNEEEFKALYPTFTQVLRSSLRGTHPDTWGQKAKEVYESLKATYKPEVTPDPEPGNKPPKNQPRRANKTAGGAGKGTEASSAMEALDSALDGM